MQLRSDFQSGSRVLKKMNPFFVNRASLPLYILERINDITQNGFIGSFILTVRARLMGLMLVELA